MQFLRTGFFQNNHILNIPPTVSLRPVIFWSDVVVYKIATSMSPKVDGEELISLFENEDGANTKTDDNDGSKIIQGIFSVQEY